MLGRRTEGYGRIRRTQEAGVKRGRLDVDQEIRRNGT